MDYKDQQAKRGMNYDYLYDMALKIEEMRMRNQLAWRYTTIVICEVIYASIVDIGRGLRPIMTHIGRSISFRCISVSASSRGGELFGGFRLPPLLPLAPHTLTMCINWCCIKTPMYFDSMDPGSSMLAMGREGSGRWMGGTLWTGAWNQGAEQEDRRGRPHV